MFIFWLMWLSLVVGVAAGCLWQPEVLRGPWMKLARVPARVRRLVWQPEETSPVFPEQERGLLSPWHVRTFSSPRGPTAPRPPDAPDRPHTRAR